MMMMIASKELQIVGCNNLRKIYIYFIYNAIISNDIFEANHNVSIKRYVQKGIKCYCCNALWLETFINQGNKTCNNYGLGSKKFTVLLLKFE